MIKRAANFFNRHVCFAQFSGAVRFGSFRFVLKCSKLSERLTVMRTSSAVISCLLLLLALTQAHSVSATQSSNDDAAADAEKALLLNVIGPALAGTSNLTNVACMFSWTESNDLCNTNIFANPVGVCSSANCFKGITCTLVFLTWRVSAIYLGNCDLAGSLPPQLNQLPYLMSLFNIRKHFAQVNASAAVVEHDSVACALYQAVWNLRQLACCLARNEA